MPESSIIVLDGKYGTHCFNYNWRNFILYDFNGDSFFEGILAPRCKIE